MIMPTMKELILESIATMRSNVTKTAITALSGMVTVFVMSALCLTLMGWSCSPDPAPKPLTLEYDKRLVKEGITDNQARAMAEATALYNRHMEAIAKGAKK